MLMIYQSKTKNFKKGQMTEKKKIYIYKRREGLLGRQRYMLMINFQMGPQRTGLRGCMIVTLVAFVQHISRQAQVIGLAEKC